MHKIRNDCMLEKWNKSGIWIIMLTNGFPKSDNIKRTLDQRNEKKHKLKSNIVKRPQLN